MARVSARIAAFITNATPGRRKHPRVPAPERGLMAGERRAARPILVHRIARHGDAREILAAACPGLRGGAPARTVLAYTEIGRAAGRARARLRGCGGSGDEA